MQRMYKSELLSHISVCDLSEDLVVDIFDDLVMDGLELYLREKKVSFPFEFNSLQEARDYMSMSPFIKREYLKNIFKEQKSILQFHEQNPEMSYENLSSLNMSKLLRKCIRLA